MPAAGCTAENPFIDRDDILAQIRKAFTARDPNYPKKRADMKKRLADLEGQLVDAQKKGDPVPCSEQILFEAQWLANYRDDWPRLERRLNDLETSLTNLDQPPLSQCDDGSWVSSPCCTEWYRKLEPTVDELQGSTIKPRDVKPLNFMKNLTQPRWTLDYLYRLQTTDIQSTGQNNRDELAAVQSALSQLIFKDGLRDLLQHPELGVSISPTLDASYADYLAQTQHPRTGYWGPWYRFGDELFMVQDLSFTFHIVQYRSGNIANWQLVVDSTFSIKELAYPAGWKPNDGAKYSNHNNYDVVTILLFGWPHMTLKQKKRARYEIQEMLTWCLTESLSNDCTEFKAAGDTELDSYYFGVRFLDRIGFWDRAKRFWLQTGLKIPAGLPTPNEICKQLKRGFAELEVDSETADNVKDILDIAECASSPSRL